MLYHFHHVHLLCSDLENTISFFRDILGSSFVGYKKFGSANGASLNLNGTFINLRTVNESAEIGGDSSTMKYGYHHICVRVEDMDEAYAELCSKGIDFISTPMIAGEKQIAFIKGPDNIVVEVLQTS